MAFTPEPEFPDLTQLITSLNNAKISVKNPALYQTIKGLIEKVQQIKGLTQENIESLNQQITDLSEVINNFAEIADVILPSPIMPVFDGIDGEDGPVGRAGLDGKDGLDGKTIPPFDACCDISDSLVPFGPFGSATSATAAAFSYTEQTTTATGTQNDFSLSAHFTVLRCNNAAALEITGFSVAGATPTAGDQVVIENIGSSTVRVAHNDGGSTAAYQATFPSTRGQILGANGTMRLVYDGTTTKWRLASVQPGAPITRSFSAGDYTGLAAMTWTVDAGDVTSMLYSQVGKMVTMIINLVTTTVGGVVSTQLKITIPNTFSAASGALNTCLVSDAGVFGAGYLFSSGTTILVGLITAGNWTAVVNNTAVQGFITFEVQ